MNTREGLPPHWHASVWPEGWDFEQGHYPDPNLKQVGWILLPERFYMVVYWPELQDGKSEHGGALIIEFEVRDDEVVVREIYGVDMDVEKWIGYFVQEFPPERWKQFAAIEITRLLASEDASEASDLPEAVAMAVTKSVRAGVDLRKRNTPEAPARGGGRRHRITEQHLEEVATIYRQAISRGEPPTRAVAIYFNVAHSTAAKWVGKARAGGALEPIFDGNESRPN